MLIVILSVCFILSGKCLSAAAEVIFINEEEKKLEC